ncbi:hypothetical protein [Pseudomonas fluorescens]|uniref:Uncharacterized protein n=1 Tax=Pseudomonas fluorescens TaxID=294 RepID=A0A5E7VU81_PSEFL|nr:hypothetical protein [Pseudomonas fluorescens]VVQ26017.1 hypothetical protein PS928_06314 [Pseudomonas fluorescens]
MGTDLLSTTAILLDLPNMLICLFLVLVFSIKLRIPKNYALLLSALCLVPFFLNGVLFPATYLGDQFRYWRAVNEIRAFQPLTDGGNVGYASYLLALIPLPLNETVRSLGFFNKFLYLIIIFFLIQKRFITHASMLFMVFYTSLILYTSLSLRDTLILFFMIFSFFALTRGYLFYSLILATPLFFIKFQNYFIQIIFIATYYLFAVRKNGISAKNSILVFSGLWLTLIAIAPIAIPEINHYRAAMYVEDGGDANDIKLISGIGDFIVTGLISGFYFLVKPLPWEAKNILQLIQSLENIFVLWFVSWVTLKCLKHDKKRALFWILFLLASSLIYGLVVFNYGTAARYRFPFLVIYILFITYDTFHNKYSSPPTHRLFNKFPSR